MKMIQTDLKELKRMWYTINQLLGNTKDKTF